MQSVTEIPVSSSHARLKRRCPLPLLLLVLVLAGCKIHGSGKPAVTITHVPAASLGGPEKLDRIEGRVTGARPGEEIVLYAHSGIWWIQPFKSQPFTRVLPDSTWTSPTHFGTSYAALLVEPGYYAQMKMESLPELGNGVVAIAVADGAPEPEATAKLIHFSGYDWTVRNRGSDRGGETNEYSSDNAWVDPQGRMHLRMFRQNGKWSCAEVSLTQSLGFGTYRFVVQDTSHLDPNAVAGFFTWDKLWSGGPRNEFDLELSRWGKPNNKNAQYAVQPFYFPENNFRFDVPPGVLTHTIQWQPDRLEFRTFRGVVDGRSATPVAQHVFTSGIPTPAAETIHMNLYEYHPSVSPARAPAEIVIESFTYRP
jgi:hypothetical protein